MYNRGSMKFLTFLFVTVVFLAGCQRKADESGSTQDMGRTEQQSEQAEAPQNQAGEMENEMREAEPMIEPEEQMMPSPGDDGMEGSPAEMFSGESSDQEVGY
jgi:predicted Fe-S protein YdhL (DUF1289 family)